MNPPKLTLPEGLDPAYSDFRNFLARCWQRLRLPQPTRLQYDAGKWMQDPDEPRVVILAFRGFGKSWITSSFGNWRLLLDVQRKFLNTSASSGKSDQATRFMLQLIKMMPELQHLTPDPQLGNRSSNTMFDVSGSLPAHAPSVFSIGIQSNLMQGSRCDDFCADDVETAKNSQTVHMRERIETACKELGGSIIRSSDEVWSPKGIYLGTPQVEDSLYYRLEEKGYRIIVYPARYPTPEENALYAGRLAPLLQEDLDKDSTLAGKPTEPTRFGEQVLRKKRMEYGKHGWALQFMLMPQLATEDLYPLCLRDAIVMDLDAEMGPEKALWDSNAKRVEVPCVGFSRDWWHAPSALVGSYRPYERSVMAIDPSAGGGDECAYVVLKMLNSQIFVMDVGGMRQGNSEETMTTLAGIARKWNIRHVLIEKNFGAGTWTKLFTNVTRKLLPDGCRTEEVTVHGRKELRIIDTLDPVMDSHRLIFNRSAIENDYESCQDYPTGKTLAFQLCYQISRLTRDVNCLQNDDRLDALALGVAHFGESMSRDYEQEIERVKSEALEEQLAQWERDVEEFGIESRSPRTERNWMSR